MTGIERLSEMMQGHRAAYLKYHVGEAQGTYLLLRDVLGVVLAAVRAAEACPSCDELRQALAPLVGTDPDAARRPAAESAVESLGALARGIEQQQFGKVPDDIFCVEWQPFLPCLARDLYDVLDAVEAAKDMALNCSRCCGLGCLVCDPLRKALEKIGAVEEGER